MIMIQPIHFRIIGYIVTLALHGVNTFIMLSAIKPDVLEKDHENRFMASMQPYYLTVWNVVNQMTYASIGLTCDLLKVFNKEYLLMKFVEKLRHIFFESLVFPITILIFIVFWPIFIYDRNLIFPHFIDRVFSSKSNYVIHLCIVPIVLWELMFQPKTQPKSHKINLSILIIYYIFYNSTIFYVYDQRGQWPYPMLTVLYGTIYFLILHVYAVIVGICAYFIQWRITSFLWDHQKVNSKMK